MAINQYAMTPAEQTITKCAELYAKYGDSKNRDEYYLWQNANLKLLGSEDQLGYIRMQKKGIKIELLDDEGIIILEKYLCCIELLNKQSDFIDNK